MQRQERDIVEKEAAKKREEVKKAEEEAARASGVAPTTSASDASARAGRNAQLGGMGLLYALGADEYLFQKVWREHRSREIEIECGKVVGRVGVSRSE